MSPTLRNEDTFHALVRRLYDAGMLVELDEVRERVWLFTLARPDDFQRLVVDPRPSNAAWGDPPPVQLPAGPLLARQLQRGRRAASSARPPGEGRALMMKVRLVGLLLQPPYPCVDVPVVCSPGSAWLASRQA